MHNSTQAEIVEVTSRYFEALVEHDSSDVARAKVAWRMSCFRSGLEYADFMERNHFALAGKQVLDPACAWGGHALAFASRGARVYAGDLNDHEFTRLRKFCAEQKLDVSLFRSDCERLPFAAESFDVILAFELVEHIPSVDRFAAEVARLLRPGGVCLLSTPARLRSLIEGEPHYGLKGLTALPFAMQGWVARSIFRKEYPYPIARQYSRASQVLKPFRVHGLSGKPVLTGRMAGKVRNWPLVPRVVREYAWNFIVTHRDE
jgi:2-polyprenyl-3-methyl-5-hydroxy-6-metoxy-1,4-benzoquinol methylase